MGAIRRRFTQTSSLNERLNQFAAEARADLERLPEGEARDQARIRVNNAERAIMMEGWLTSRELRSPSR
jgi:hypothetical protein